MTLSETLPYHCLNSAHFLPGSKAPSAVIMPESERSRVDTIERKHDQNTTKRNFSNTQEYCTKLKKKRIHFPSVTFNNLYFKLSNVQNCRTRFKLPILQLAKTFTGKTNPMEGSVNKWIKQLLCNFYKNWEMCVKSKKNTTKANRQLLFQSARVYTAEITAKVWTDLLQFLVWMMDLKTTYWIPQEYFMENWSLFLQIWNNLTIITSSMSNMSHVIMYGVEQIPISCKNRSITEVRKGFKFWLRGEWLIRCHVLCTMHHTEIRLLGVKLTFDGTKRYTSFQRVHVSCFWHLDAVKRIWQNDPGFIYCFRTKTKWKRDLFWTPIRWRW